MTTEEGSGNNDGKMADQMNTPTPKRRKLKQRLVSDSDDEPEFIKVESKDEIRIKKAILANIESLDLFYRTSQSLKTYIKNELGNAAIDDCVGCTNLVQSFGNLSPYKDLRRFKDLKNYQQCGVHWLSVLHKFENASAILADEMGLGKTAQVCIFLEHIYRELVEPTNTSANVDSNDATLKKDDPARPLKGEHDGVVIQGEEEVVEDEDAEGGGGEDEVEKGEEPEKEDSDRPGITLIVVPVSILNIWVEELKTWTDLSPNVAVFHGLQKERMAIMEDILNRFYRNELAIILTTLGMMNGVEIKVLKQMQPFEYLIIDEAHLLKNSNSNIYRRLFTSFEIKHKLLLTGTPIQNSMAELCNLLQFAMPEVFDAFRINEAIYQIVNNLPFLHSIAEDVQVINELALEELDSKGIDEDLSTTSTTSNLNRLPNHSNNSGNVTTANNGDEVSGGENVGAEETSMFEYINEMIEKSRKGLVIDKELKIIQKLTTPFILRRLKKNVMDELPPKKSVYVGCKMTPLQERVYALHLKNSSFNTTTTTTAFSGGANTASSGPHLTTNGSALNPSSNNSTTNGTTTSSTGGEPPITDKASGSSNNEKENEDEGEDEAEFVDEKFKKNNGIHTKVFKLRRICNHPLLVRGTYYGEDVVPILTDLIGKKDGDHSDSYASRVQVHLESISDFDIHNLFSTYLTGTPRDGRLSARSTSGSTSASSTREGSGNGMNLKDLSPKSLFIEDDLFLQSGKIAKMFEIIKLVFERNEKVIVFSQFTTYLDIIEKCMAIRGMRNYLRLDGSLSVKEKARILKLFNHTTDITNNSSTSTDPSTTSSSSSGGEVADFGILLVSTKVGNVGLNLTVANNVVLMDQSWNPHNDLQAEDRCHRIGQSKPVNVYKLFTLDTIEEYIILKSTNKLHLKHLFNETI